MDLTFYKKYCRIRYLAYSLLLVSGGAVAGVYDDSVKICAIKKALDLYSFENEITIEEEARKREEKRQEEKAKSPRYQYKIDTKISENADEYALAGLNLILTHLRQQSAEFAMACIHLENQKDTFGSDRYDSEDRKKIKQACKATYGKLTKEQSDAVFADADLRIRTSSNEALKIAQTLTDCQRTSKPTALQWNNLEKITRCYCRHKKRQALGMPGKIWTEKDLVVWRNKYNTVDHKKVGETCNQILGSSADADRIYSMAMQERLNILRGIEIEYQNSGKAHLEYFDEPLVCQLPEKPKAGEKITELLPTTLW